MAHSRHDLKIRMSDDFKMRRKMKIDKQHALAAEIPLFDIHGKCE